MRVKDRESYPETSEFVAFVLVYFCVRTDVNTY